MAPIIHELRRRNISTQIVVTGQHRQMLDQMLSLFEIEADHDLDIMTPNQTLESITYKTLEGISAYLANNSPSVILVQGDTTAAFASALSGFYNKIPVAHVEAGLRTDNIYNPFPEEINRRLVSQLATLHFPPTLRSRDNLLASGVPSDKIEVTGNTVIDALLWVRLRTKEMISERIAPLIKDGKHVLVTTHRRENLGDGMASIFSAINTLAIKYPDISFIFPVHLNPLIQEHSKKAFINTPNVHLLDPLGYADLVQVMDTSLFVMTDSGGIQEEAPALNKPVLVLRSTTERQEGVEAGTSVLVGLDADRIVAEASNLLEDESHYKTMANAVNPYGDGTAAKKIVDRLVADFS